MDGKMNRPKVDERKEARQACVEHRGAYDKVSWSAYMDRLEGDSKEGKFKPRSDPRTSARIVRARRRQGSSGTSSR